MNRLPRIVSLHGHGGPEVLRFEPFEPPPPGPGEVTLAVRAIGLNRSEVMFRRGQHIEAAEFPARLGYEAAGAVMALGEGVQGLTVGDAVSLVPPPSVTRWGTYGEVVTVPAEFVVHHPPNLSWVEAAALWMAHVTAYGALVDIAGLKDGETAIVLAASSSVGLAAFQVAHAVGATVVATTRATRKWQALLEAGADHVIVTEGEDLAARVREITAGRGARVVFDPVGGPGVETLVRAMAPQGILIAYGALDPAPTPMPLFAMIAQGLTVRGYTFKEIVLDRGRCERAVAFILSGLTSGRLKPPPIAKVFPFDQIAEAHRFLESNEQFGKIVVTVP